MTTTPDKTATPAPPAPDLVTLTIDGLEVSVPKGTLIIRAAEQVGIEIPRFCDHPGLDPIGACRQCLVEVAMPGPPGPDGTPGQPRQMQGPPGRMKPQASCTMTVAPGMVVNTQYTSPGAHKAQEGVMEFLLINHPLDCPVCDKGGECPLQNQAMSAGRATSRFEDSKRTYPKPIHISSQVLLDRERCVLCARCTRFSDQIAGDPFIALVERGALQQVGIYEEHPFESYFSGNTVQICPVGALTGAAYRFRSRPFDLVSTPSVCEHCASGCAIRTDHRRGTVLRRMARPDAAVNEEWNCDKGRWAFAYATTGDRFEFPMVRENGELRVASWPEALRVAAAGLSNASAAGVLTGGRVSVEDAYAYGKFARQVLDTNDVDFRARAHSAEESEFLAAHVVGTGPESGAVTYADLESAATVLLVGLEPEDESPILFLRLRKAFRKHKTAVYALSPMRTRGLAKVGGQLIAAAPGTETEVLEALRSGGGSDTVAAAAAALAQGGVILVGERLATVPGALSAAATLAEATGARLAWVPRRAGERGALEAGAFPSLLPGGRPVADDAARGEVAAAWELVGLPDTSGRDAAGIVAAARAGEIDALVIGGVDPLDLGVPDAEAVFAAPFVVSLEVRPSAVTAYADVVLPVAWHAEKEGSFVDWEGRVRPFEAAIASGYVSDYRALDMLADEMGHFLGTRTHREISAEMAALGTGSAPRPASPNVAGVEPRRVEAGHLVLATWRHLLDAGSLQDGEPHLAGTAPAPYARISATTAAHLGLADGERVRVGLATGESVTVPVCVTEMADHVLWLPTNSAGCDLRAALATPGGDHVYVTKDGDA
ncbi:MAG: NADH-quinone oxidoreductase subunit G [Tetrasphaera sp.]|nr:NADH-quinone oxidoreductase subunit G [Tetrasphaera sp.]